MSKTKPKQKPPVAANAFASRAVSFRLPDELLDALDAAAERHGIKRNRLVAALLTAYVKDRPAETDNIAKEAKRVPNLFN